MKAFADLINVLNDIFDVLAGILDKTNVYHLGFHLDLRYFEMFLISIL